MHIISPKKFRDFWRTNKESQTVLDNWIRFVKKANWANFAELKQDFPLADLVGKCIVFNVGGNKYRVITKVYFKQQTILIRFVLTHKEYDKDEWKKDCG